jgi:hypothetical protein
MHTATHVCSLLPVGVAERGEGLGQRGSTFPPPPQPSPTALRLWEREHPHRERMFAPLLPYGEAERGKGLGDGGRFCPLP